MNAAQEKKWKEMWRKGKYPFLGEIKKAGQRGGEGMGLEQFSNMVDLPPQEAQLFFNAIVGWGANLYVRENQIFAHETIAVTQGTHEDLIPFQEMDILGQRKVGLRFGVVADTHFGSPTLELGGLRAAYRYFADQGINHVVHAGNVLAGKAEKRYRQADRLTEDLEEQIALLKEQYPRLPGITTHFILGHADRTFEAGKINPGQEISEARPDFHYLGVVETDLVFNPEGKKPFTVRIYNEKPYYTYGISYQPQKKLEAMAGGDKPNVWLVSGAQQLWYSPYQEVETVKLPGLQHQTLKMRDRAYSGNVGFITFSVIPEEQRIRVYTEQLSVWKKTVPKIKT